MDLGTVPIFFYEPVPEGSDDVDNKGIALSDIGFDLAWGKTNTKGWLYGGGMVATSPSATDEALGKERWAVGPELLFGAIGKWGTVGALLTHQWDFAGSGDADINLTGFNYW